MLRELPSVLLVALACAQIALAFGANLSPWKGGGFGMFATNDHGGFRKLRAYAIRDGREERLALPAELGREELRAAWLPTEGGLRRFADALARAGEAPDAQAVRIEVWRTDFDSELRPTQTRIAELVAERTR